MRTRLAALSCLASMGCAAVGQVQRADTLGTGNLEVGFEPGAQVFGGPRGAAPVPALDAALRIGVSERVDLGLRLGFPWAEVQGKVLLTEPGDPKLAVSIAPSFGGTAMPTSGAPVTVVHASLPVLIGFKFGAHELVLGPRLMLYASPSSMTGDVVVSPGGSLGVALQVTKHFALMPEVALSAPVFGLGPGGGGLMASQTGAVSTIAQFRLGLLISRRRSAAAP